MAENDQGEGLVRVGEMARRVGMSPRTIKYYEERGLLSPARSEGRYRLYSESDAERLARIRQMRAFGLSIATIEEALRHPTHLDDDGIRRLSLDALEEVYESLGVRRDDLLARLDQGRRELAAVEAVARELEHDLGYLRGHLEARRAERPPAPALSAVRRAAQR
jgi:MerR family transcriptional regulator, repressor of the yfmOP operon